MVSSQPTLRDTRFVVLHDVGMVADKKERAVVLQIDLHTDQTIGVTGKMVQSDPLSKINCAIIERLPIKLI